MMIIIQVKLFSHAIGIYTGNTLAFNSGARITWMVINANTYSVKVVTRGAHIGEWCSNLISYHVRAI